MTKSDYMKILSHKLRRLPKEDFDKAIEYFEEYFEEAGPGNEQHAIQDLGEPEAAANELIMNLAEKNLQEPPKTVKKGFSAIWIGVLGVCAAPIAVPLAFALLAVIIACVIVVLACIFCILLAAVSIAAVAILSLFGGAVLLFTSFADGLTSFGLSLCALGAGLLLVYGSFIFCRWFIKRVSKSLGKITKGGRKNEKNH